jgi:hypothetical protein
VYEVPYEGVTRVGARVLLLTESALFPPTANTRREHSSEALHRMRHVYSHFVPLSISCYGSRATCALCTKPTVVVENFLFIESPPEPLRISYRLTPDAHPNLTNRTVNKQLQVLDRVLVLAS